MNKKKKFRKFLSIFFMSLVYVFLYLPIVIVIFFSFNTSKMNIIFQGFTLKWYAVMFQNVDLMTAFQNSVIVAAACVAISTVVGTLAAIGMYRYKFRGKNMIDNILYIPIVIPEIVMGISLLAFFTILGQTPGYVTLIVAHATFSIPYVVFTVRSRIAGYDMAVEEAAMDLGANRLRTLFRVTIPIIAPGIAAGAMLALTLSLDDVIVSFFTTGVDSTTLPIYIFNKIKTGVSPDVNALATVIVLATVFVILFLRIREQGAAKRKARKTGVPE